MCLFTYMYELYVNGVGVTCIFLKILFFEKLKGVRCSDALVPVRQQQKLKKYRTPLLFILSG
jgi:hypothetical protein